MLKRAIVIAAWMVAIAAMAAPERYTSRQLVQMPSSSIRQGEELVLDGVVVFVSQLNPGRIIVVTKENMNGSGVYVQFAEGVELPVPGDVVSIPGRFGILNRHVLVEADGFDTIRQVDLPSALSVKQSDFRKGLLYGRRIMLRGVVSDVRNEVEGGMAVARLSLHIDNYNACINVPGEIERESLLGREVRVTGAVTAQYSQDGRLLETQLELASADDIVPVASAMLFEVALWISVTLGGAFLILSIVLLSLWLRESSELREAEVIAAERRRMAADLHDTIEQHMAGANLIAAGVLSIENLPEPVADAMHSLAALLANAKTEVRDAVMNLRADDRANVTLDEEVASILAAISKTGIRARRCLRGLPAHIEHGRKHDLLLVIREAVTNAIKHGKAKTILVTSDPLPGGGGFRLDVLNDGEPFDIDCALGPEMGHYGLAGMRERALRSAFSITWTRRDCWNAVSLEFTTARKEKI